MVRYQIPSFQNAPELPDTLLNGDLCILTGNFGVISAYGDASKSSYVQFGYLVVTNFWMKTSIALSTGDTSIGQMQAKDSNPPRETSYFVATAPNGTSYPCSLSKSGDIIIMNYAGAIPAQTQLFAHFSYLAQNTPSQVKW